MLFHEVTINVTRNYVHVHTRKGPHTWKLAGRDGLRTRPCTSLVHAGTNTWPSHNLAAVMAAQSQEPRVFGLKTLNWYCSLHDLSFDILSAFYWRQHHKFLLSSSDFQVLNPSSRRYAYTHFSPICASAPRFDSRYWRYYQSSLDEYSAWEKWGPPCATCNT